MDGHLPVRTVGKLQTLLRRRQKLDAACENALDALAVAALEACEAGASRSQLAKALGVGTSTVQGWTVRGRHVRGR